jgi:hypothetical protein
MQQSAIGSECRPAPYRAIRRDEGSGFFEGKSGISKPLSTVRDELVEAAHALGWELTFSRESTSEVLRRLADEVPLTDDLVTFRSVASPVRGHCDSKAHLVSCKRDR